MPGVLLPNSSRSSMKRPAESTFADASHPPKRMRQVHHAIKYKQPLASESTRGIQNENVFQSQLLRAITLALSAQGYDEAQSLALEAFRAEVEECKLKSSSISIRPQFLTSYSPLQICSSFLTSYIIP